MRNKFILIAIILLASFLRLYNLGENPPALFGDEVSYSYNAYSILKTGKDEHGRFLPLQFVASGDYKSPVPVYTLVIFEGMFGLSPFSVRLPFALAGILTVLLTYFLTKEIFNNIKEKEEIALLAGALISVSPWHLQVSRGVLDATLALFLFISGLLFFLKSRTRSFFLPLSAICFSLSFFSYHPPKIFLFLFVPILVALNKEWVISTQKYFITFCAIGLLTFSAFTYLSVFNKGASRFASVNIFNAETAKDTVENERKINLLKNEKIKEIFHNKPLYFLKTVRENYLIFFSPQFWFSEGEGNLALTVGRMGEMYTIEIILLLPGLYFLLKNDKRNSLFFLFWAIIAPIPAALSGRTYVLRSIFILPLPMIITAFGAIALFKKLENKNQLVKLLPIISFITIYLFSVFSYLEKYHYRYPLYAGTWWGYDNLSIINYAKENRSLYDQIIIPDTGDMPTTYAFYEKIEPVVFLDEKTKDVKFKNWQLKRKFGKTYIGSLELKKDEPEDELPPKTIYISKPEETPNARNFLTIRDRGDGRVLFRIFRSKDLLN